MLAAGRSAERQDRGMLEQQEHVVDRAAAACRGECLLQGESVFVLDAPEIMERFRWAYVAYNEFTSAYFIIETPTPT
jgi:hypothetical protein